MNTFLDLWFINRSVWRIALLTVGLVCAVSLIQDDACAQDKTIEHSSEKSPTALPLAKKPKGQKASVGTSSEKKSKPIVAEVDPGETVAVELDTEETAAEEAETDEAETEEIETDELDIEDSDAEDSDIEDAEADADAEESESEGSDSEEAEVVKPQEQKPRAKKSTKQERVMLGWVENIVLYPEDVLLTAKLTPGSEGNVLHAENIEPFKKDGVSWLRFQSTGRKGITHTLERAVVEEKRYRTTRGTIQKRYVVRVAFCLQNKYLEMPFALSDRSEFEYEVRIGRDALAGHFTIDPARTKTIQPKCDVQSGSSSE